ncbi:MAG: hypothetical protein IJV14_05180 [Lachnospiraceae bacterium]|nr:hypothetical protein [Lachnospiraceae bacterium]
MDEREQQLERYRQRKLRRKRQQRRRRIGIAFFTILLLLVIGMIVYMAISVRSGKESEKDILVGTWSSDLVTFYTFDGKGSGSMQTSLSIYDFSYELKEQAVVIDYEDETVSDAAYSFSLSDDGSILILTSYDGSIFEMTKQP